MMSKEKSALTILTDKYSSESIMIWSCFSSMHTGVLHIVEGAMDSKIYHELQEKKQKKLATICEISLTTKK